MSNVNVKELSGLIQELNELSKKPKLSPSEERRNAFLLAAISAVKSGASLADIEDNERRSYAGLPERYRTMTAKEERLARAFKEFVERRNMTEGSIISQLGTYTSLGNFIPTDFFPQVFAAMKAADALFDKDLVTYVESSNGRPLPVPTYDDTSSTAVLTSEANNGTEVDIANPSHSLVPVFSFSTPRFVASLESFEDVEGSLTVAQLFKKFSADRIARGASAYLVNGGGSTQPLGLITALLQAGVNPVIVRGTGGPINNDGGAAYNLMGGSGSATGSYTGANSIGSYDFAAAKAALDPAYINDKTRWLMNNATLTTLEGYIGNDGQPLRLVQYDSDGSPRILGIKVAICPSMPNIGAASNPVILGDMSYWMTRVVVDDLAGVKIYTEGPGLAEYGNVGFRTFARVGGALLWGGGSSSPFVILQNHS